MSLSQTKTKVRVGTLPVVRKLIRKFGVEDLHDDLIPLIFSPENPVNGVRNYYSHLTRAEMEEVFKRSNFLQLINYYPAAAKYGDSNEIRKRILRHLNPPNE